MIDTTQLPATPHFPSSQSPPSNKKTSYCDLALSVNRSLFRDSYIPITKAEKYKAEYLEKVNIAMDSFDPDTIAQAASSNRKVEVISKPLFEGKKFIYFAEGRRDSLPYKITCDYSMNELNPAISCEVLPFA